MDANLLPKTDIKDFIAYPKDWQREGKHNRPRPFKQYPLMPLIVGKGGKLVPIYLDREGLRPLTFANAREETEYLRANPDMARHVPSSNRRQTSWRRRTNPCASSLKSTRKLLPSATPWRARTRTCATSLRALKRSWKRHARRAVVRPGRFARRGARRRRKMHRHRKSGAGSRRRKFSQHSRMADVASWP